MNSTTQISLAEVLVFVEKDAFLPIQTKRDMASAVRKVASWIGPDGLRQPANPGVLAERMRRLSPAMIGISREGMANIRSRLRRALKLAGISVHGGKQTNVLSPDWLKIYELVGTDRSWRALSGFAHFASSRNWSPSQIVNAHFEVFRSVLTNEAIHRAPEQTIYRLRKTWNECAANIPGWPGMPVVSTPRRIPYVVKEAILPETLRQQISEHFQRLQNPPVFPQTSKTAKAGSPFAPSSRGIAPTTARRQRYQLQQFLSALILTGMQPQEMTDLAKLVTPELAERGLLYFYERAGQRVSSQLELIGLVLVGIAERYLCDDNLAKNIRGMLKNARKRRRRRREMSPNVRERLRQFDDHRNRMSFLKLTGRLVKLAHTTKSKCPSKSARLFECALAIELLINCPIRIGNVAGLHIDRHFCRSRPGPNGIMHLIIPSEEVKNRQAVEFELPLSVARLFKIHIEMFRPHLPGSNSGWLFPQAGGANVDPKSLAVRISRTVRHHTGIRMNCHMFRHVAAETLDAAPGGHELVRHLLGHATSTTSELFYTRRNMDKAVQRYAEIILKARQDVLPPSRKPRRKNVF